MVTSTRRIGRRAFVEWVAAAAAGFSARAVVGPFRQTDAPPVPSTDELVDAAARYVARYQRAFLSLIADERYAQVRTVDGGRDPERREMRGELFLTYLEAERRWIAIRDVAEVDGQVVPDRAGLRALLRAADARSVAARLAARNARYNLGRVERNFNEPTLALRVFGEDRRRQFRFSREGVTREGGVTLVTLAFRERDRPTLVSSVRGGPVYATGEALVEAFTGRVRRLEIAFEDEPVSATLETRFADAPRLGLWVPVLFTERYRLDEDGRGETIACEARYTNYRRFETSGRLAID